MGIYGIVVMPIKPVWGVIMEINLKQAETQTYC
jgi:hypothetical protein